MDSQHQPPSFPQVKTLPIHGDDGFLSANFYGQCSPQGQYQGWQDLAGINHRFVSDASAGKGHQPLLAKQIHSAIIHEIHDEAGLRGVHAFTSASASTRGNGEASQKERYPVEADGIICSLKGHTIGVVTADCVPVLIAGRHHVAALHCGWRGLQQGLLGRALNRLIARGEDIKELRLVTGPHIQAGAFEVGPEVVEAFVGSQAVDHLGWALALSKGRADRWHLDMGIVVSLIATSYGVQAKHIGISRECTMTGQDAKGSFIWPSYRRAGKNCGRLISSISLTD